MVKKETSARISAIGGRYMNITAAQIRAMTDEQLEEFANDVQSISASAVVQDETPDELGNENSSKESN